jgi:hypothetical protein
MKSARDRIFEVADDIDAGGQKPTLAAVRKAIGGGSFTTISEAMKEWRSQKTAKETRPLVPPPSAVTERLADLGAEVWSLALEMANGQLAVERDAFDKAKTALEIDKQEAVELVDQVTADLEAALCKTAESEAATRAAEGNLSALREQVAALSERIAAAEARAAEASLRADDLNAELARVNAQNAELVKALSGNVKKSIPNEVKV